MPTRKVAVASRVGLHARPAVLFVQKVQQLGVPVTIATAEGSPVLADSILMVMAAGIHHGDVVTLAAEGDGADSALDSLVALLNRDLDAKLEPARD